MLYTEIHEIGCQESGRVSESGGTAYYAELSVFYVGSLLGFFSGKRFLTKGDGCRERLLHSTYSKSRDIGKLKVFMIS